MQFVFSNNEKKISFITGGRRHVTSKRVERGPGKFERKDNFVKRLSLMSINLKKIWQR